MYGPEALRIADDWNTPNPSEHAGFRMLPNVVYASASATNAALWPLCCVLLETSVYMGFRLF